MDEQKRKYTFGNNEFSIEDAYHDCKLVFDGITDDDSFQKADTGLILYYANEIIYALHEALQGKDTDVLSNDCISRPAALDEKNIVHIEMFGRDLPVVPVATLKGLPPAQPSQDKYEYHYDHTDCIWYRPEARNRCPCTCAQYRDGWNDAMNYIFRDGEGYRPFRRDKKYEG